MNPLKSKLPVLALRRVFKFLLPALALMLVAVDPAMAAGTVTGNLANAFTAVNDLTPGVKGIVAVVGFVVALISLTALRSFGAVLFFVGLAIFGGVGLTVATTIMGAPIALI